ncbi:MAG: hypothetical protein FRX49_06262 [Trebouxia sp. A1-2]|nr:MAG: hypothetical protein FRX49_06262 [Trebouxia sp. A1-2]
MLPEHIKVVSPSALPWEHEQGVQTKYLDQALIYNWLDQGNMFHQMMEAGNFIYATACRLLDACTHDTSHYQLFATGYFEFANDNGLPAAHESLQCLTSRMPRWIEDPYWDDQVVVIGKTAVGLGGHCDESEHQDKLQCEWDSISYMQNEYTSGHRQLLLDCLGVRDESSKPSQQQTKVTIMQRLLAKGRSMLNILEMKSAIAATGAEVQIVNMEGKTLKWQAELLAHSHVYILVHGAAMALYMFLPKHAAIIEIQHHYAHSAVYPSDMHQRTVTRYDMDYHHELLITQKSTDISLQKEKVLKDEVYQKLTCGEQLQLWEQGLCPGEKRVTLLSRHLQSLTRFQNPNGNTISHVNIQGSQYGVLRATNKSRSAAEQQQTSSAHPTLAANSGRKVVSASTESQEAASAAKEAHPVIPRLAAAEKKKEKVYAVRRVWEASDRPRRPFVAPWEQKDVEPHSIPMVVQSQHR